MTCGLVVRGNDFADFVVPRQFRGKMSPGSVCPILPTRNGIMGAIGTGCTPQATPRWERGARAFEAPPWEMTAGCVIINCAHCIHACALMARHGRSCDARRIKCMLCHMLMPAAALLAL